MKAAKAVTRCSGIRSTHGCWTCRLRRKKCDETLPVCVTCTSLSITCYGYGARPSWMDRGPLEKEKAHDIKLEISRNGIKRRRRRSSLPTSTLVISAREGAHAVSQAEVRAGTGSKTDGQLRTPLDVIPKGVHAITEGDPQDEVAFSSLIGQTESSAVAHQISIAADDASSTYEPSRHAFSLGSFPDNNHEWKSSDYVMDYDICMQMDASRPIDTFVSLPEGSSRGSTFGPPSSLSYHVAESFGTRDQAPEITPGELSVKDAIHLSAYLEGTLSVQLPFRRTSDVSNRRICEVLLFSSNQFLQITLILSRLRNQTEAELDLGRNGNGSLVSQAMGILGSLSPPAPSPSTLPMSTLGEKEVKTSHAISVCSCTLQVIYLELLVGETSNWTECLRNVAVHVQELVHCAGITSVESDSLKTARMSEVCRIQAAAAKTLLGKLVWLDIVGIISTGRGPFLGTDHNHILDSVSFNLAETSGCQNWVAKSLYTIHHLRRWKAEQMDAQQLNVIELAEKGVAILERLQDNLTKLDGHWSSVGESHELNVEIITMAYARVAVIYLHVIISGPNPFLQEIQRETRELVKNLKVISLGGLLCHACLPLCVACCFSEDQDFNFFEELVSIRRGLGKKSFETCEKAMTIAGECRDRLKDGREHDWISTMEELGLRLLLL